MTCAAIARHIVAAKIASSRVSLLRAARDRPGDPAAAQLGAAAQWLDHRIAAVMREPSLDVIRGIEGDSAAAYFACIPALLTTTDPAITMNGRNRRPPLDPVNALLSFSTPSSPTIAALLSPPRDSIPPSVFSIATGPAVRPSRLI